MNPIAQPVRANNPGGIFLFFGLLLPLGVFVVRALYVLLDAYLPYDTEYGWCPI